MRRCLRCVIVGCVCVCVCVCVRACVCCLSDVQFQAVYLVMNFTLLKCESV